MTTARFKIAAVHADASKAAIDWIRGIVAEPEAGVVYTGKWSRSSISALS